MPAFTSQHVTRSLESSSLTRLTRPKDHGRPGIASKRPSNVCGAEDRHQSGQEYHAAQPTYSIAAIARIDEIR
jgi:hypothetical protein